MLMSVCHFFFFKQKTAYEMRISDWSSDVCSSDLLSILRQQADQREQELQELQSKAKQFESSLNLAQQELNIYLPLAKSGVVPEVELLRLRREVNDLNGDRKNVV